MTTLAVHLRDTETGDAGVLQMEYADERLDGLPYHFGEGNYSCDCNRSNFLADAINGEYDTDLPCNPNGQNRIAVDKIESPSGAVLYADVVR